MKLNHSFFKYFLTIMIVLLAGLFFVNQKLEAATSQSVTVIVEEGPGLETTSGYIEAQSESCRIPDNQNFCMVNFDWETIRPLVKFTSKVTRNPAEGFTVQNANSGSSVPLPVHHGNNTYILEHAEKELDRTSVSATCQTGSGWISAQNKCVKNLATSLSAPSCTIQTWQNSCETNVSWSAIGGTGTFRVKTPENIIVGEGRTGSKTWTIERPSRSFSLENDGIVKRTVR